MKKSCLSVARVCPLLAHSLNSSQTEDTWGNLLLPSSPRTQLLMFFDQMFAPQAAVVLEDSHVQTMARLFNPG